MRCCRVDYHDLQTYIGHAPQSVLSRHYNRASMERFSEIAGMAQHLHDLMGPFEKYKKNLPCKDPAQSRSESQTSRPDGQEVGKPTQNPRWPECASMIQYDI